MEIPKPNFDVSWSSVHQSFDWGLLICDASNQTIRLICDASNQSSHRWLFGTDSRSNFSSLTKQYVAQRDQVGVINNNFWLFGGHDSCNRRKTRLLPLKWSVKLYCASK